MSISLKATRRAGDINATFLGSVIDGLRILGKHQGEEVLAPVVAEPIGLYVAAPSSGGPCSGRMLGIPVSTAPTAGLLLPESHGYRDLFGEVGQALLCGVVVSC